MASKGKHSGRPPVITLERGFRRDDTLAHAYRTGSTPLDQRARSYNVAYIRPRPTVGGSTRGPTGANEVAVLILDNVLVDPPVPYGSSALFGNHQRGQRVLGRAQEPAELAGFVVRIERRELAQVQEAFAADVFDRVEVDLEGDPSWHEPRRSAHQAALPSRTAQGTARPNAPVARPRE